MNTRQMFREPLVHFLAIGAALFLVAEIAGRGSTAEPSRRIVVAAGQIERLIEGFGRTWQRSPTRAELDGLIADFVQEEIFYREALALGLDRDDAIIRRRLRQKMEFLSEDLAEVVEPTDDDLQRYLEEHAGQFRLDAQYTLSHIYFSEDRHGAATHDLALRTLAQLRRSENRGDPGAHGDPIPLPQRFERASEREVASLFGQEFATAVNTLEPGSWQGPIRSGYGIHLVFVAEHIEGRVPELAEVRADVEREWRFTRRQEVNSSLYGALRDQYLVTIEWPE